MVHIVKLLIIFFLGTAALFAQQAGKGKVELLMHNFKSNEGSAMVALYKTKDSFLKTPFTGQKVEIVEGKAKAVFDKLEPGTYAVAVFHDENNNGELDTNFIGIPKERTGTSNNAPANWGPPKWKIAKFELQKERFFNIKLK